MQNKGVGRMMLSGLIAIAKYHAASKIIVYPVPVDLQIEEIQPLTNEVLYDLKVI
jgi:hypothetical protein